MLETIFCVGLHCRVDDLMLPFLFPPMAFCTYITMLHIDLFVGTRRIVRGGRGKKTFFHNNKDMQYVLTFLEVRIRDFTSGSFE